MKQSRYRQLGILSAVAIVVLLLSIWTRSSTPVEQIVLPEVVDFNYDIRPILSQNCFVCHGPDSSSRKAGLRLDIREGALANLESNNIAIVPGKPNQSELIRKITDQDREVQMPPPESGKTLTNKEVALLRKWIDQGADYQPHWAFTTPHFPRLPPEIADRSPSEIIDHLIDKEHKEKGLSTGTRSDDKPLIRRTSYQLTGLPPTLEELAMFEPLDSQDDVTKMVDYYLASPHFGERWARHWMDLVRYGEFRGHEYDYPVGGAWHYRDYLIRAFNADLPYDQLVKEHLAGDLLQQPRLHPTKLFNESIIGTGYANLGEGKHSPVSVKEEEATTIDNMIDVTSKTFLGLTVGCARCHDHKFDPIPTTDYYALYGMFESTRLGPVEIGRPVTDSLLLQRLRNSKNQIGLQSEQPIDSDEVDRQINYLTSLAQNEATTMAGDQVQMQQDFQEDNWNEWKADGLAFGTRPIRNLDEHVGSPNDKKNPTSLIASSRYYSPGIQGTLRSPNFIIDKDSLFILARGDSSTIRIIVDNFQLIQDPLYGSFSTIVDHTDWRVHGLDVSMVKGHKAYLEFIPGVFNWHAYEIDQDNYLEVHSSYIANQKREHTNAHAYQTNKAPNTPRPAHAPYSRDPQPDLHIPEFFMGMTEGPAIFSPVFHRGSHLTPEQEKVPHGFIQVLSKNGAAFSQTGSGRLSWAQRIIDPSNPLAARVLVNRVWHYLFGRGIVATVDNFGLQGELPSHPELLDYLAIQFVKDGWSIKTLIRHIILTQAFQRSAVAMVGNNEIDPENIYLHHYPVRRLEAEAIRDGILASAGSLDTNLYGQPVPIYLTQFMTGRGRPKQSGPIDGNGRRSIYNEVRRNFMEPMMEVFDRPTPFSTFGQRNVTNVPAQSLTMMNDPFVHDQALKWATKLIEQPGLTSEDRIEQIYLTAFARLPNKEEYSFAYDLLDTFKEQYKDSQDQASEIYIWKEYCHAIFNFKEFVFLI